MAIYYLTEVVWPARDDMSGRPLEFRLVAQCRTLEDCNRQAENRAKRHRESGFDAALEAWWGGDGERVHYYHRATERPGRFWKGMKPKTEKPKSPDVGVPLDAKITAKTEEASLGTSRGGEEPGEGPQDRPEKREDEDLPPISGT
ncbi:MAG: hypothetical protein JO188_20595 [Hyphomicrobiales bacterium]|nr:hypothetical protein [Hyphomicrobiales bacterium]